MSIHPSLRVDTASASQRSVLTRIERIKDLMKKGLWTENQGAVALPKTKIVRIKAVKTAKEEKPAEGAAPGAETAKEAPAKGAKEAPAAKGKEASAKGKESPAKEKK